MSGLHQPLLVKVRCGRTCGGRVLGSEQSPTKKIGSSCRRTDEDNICSCVTQPVCVVIKVEGGNNLPIVKLRASGRNFFKPY